jgi:UDP-N-acetylmuramate--alanine ligase
MSKHIHFLGIAGSGASAAASIARAYGFKVTGCDTNPTGEFIPELKGIQIHAGHSASHLQDVDILAITPAVTSLDPENEELVEAEKRKIKIMTWQEFLGRKLTKDKYVIAVSGTHGKTTTTAMIAQILEDAGLDPTVVLGAINPKWGKNFRVGESKYFVVEADEFNDNFQFFTPEISIVTNIEYDHPEYFKDFTSYKRSFQNFLYNTKSQIIANLEDPGVASTVGGEYANSFFKPVIDYSQVLVDFPLKVIGEHNRFNATAAYMAGKAVGINPKVIKESLENFTGIGRRMEYLGSFKGAEIFTDFGHHPTEIKTTIKAFREKFKDNRIILIFQPHMFSRTKALFDDFVKVFRTLPVDLAIIADIYPSREVDTGLIKSWQLVESINKQSFSSNKPNVIYQSPEELKETVHKEIKAQDVVIFMGAGDIDLLARKLASK